MIGSDKFLAEIRAIRALNPTYREGGYGVNGICDCIGLIIGAIRRAGGNWTGTHGSNYAARSEMVGKLRPAVAGELRVGCARTERIDCVLDILMAYQGYNRCYTKGRPCTIKGLLLHETAAVNPTLKRYVEAPIRLGKNIA